MARGSSSDRQKKKQNRRRVTKQRKQGGASLAKPATAKLSEKLAIAWELVDRRRFDEAEETLDRLAKRYGRYPAVAEAQVYLYQTMGDHEACCQAAKRLATLTPRDPDALLMYAQESAFCGRIGIGLTHCRRFLERWPDHPNAKKARAAISLLEDDCLNKARDIGLDSANLGLLAAFEEVLEQVQASQFEDAAQQCLEFLRLVPDCIPARNNLALAYFHAGAVEKAVHVAEETSEQAPDNRFAETMLGKLRFLTGDSDQANAIADQIVVDPPTDQDALAATIELLSFLGRDEDVVKIAGSAQKAPEIVDPRCRAMILHHLAVAQFRLGDEKTARSSWKKCLQAMPAYAAARENLDDLESGEGHAPWFEPLAKWIPRSVIDEMLKDRGADEGTGQLDLIHRCPMIAALVPALLDRGDPLGRELAMRLAAADGSPAMLDALQEFASSSRGPDSMRHDALNTLREADRIGAGPHRFYSRGKWTEIKLFTAEITCEATAECDPRAQELIETGTKALYAGDFSRAEDLLNQALEASPDNCSAAYNLCVVWLQRDGAQGRRRAIPRLEDLHARRPDYLFASITLAQFAAIDGDLERATDLLKPAFEATTLHVTEAAALFATQIEIALKRRDYDLAEQSFEMFKRITGDDDPRVPELRRLIDAETGSRRLARLMGLS